MPERQQQQKWSHSISPGRLRTPRAPPHLRPFLGAPLSPCSGLQRQNLGDERSSDSSGLLSPVFKIALLRYKGFPGGSAVKKPPATQQMQTQLRSLDREDPPGEGMATHSSILAWEIPWTEDPMGYSPWGGKKLDIT